MSDSQGGSLEDGSRFPGPGPGGRGHFDGGRGRRRMERGPFAARGHRGRWQPWPHPQRRAAGRGLRHPRAGIAGGGAPYRPEDEPPPEGSAVAHSPSDCDSNRARGRRPRRPRAGLGPRGRRPPCSPARGGTFPLAASAPPTRPGSWFPLPQARLHPRPERAGFGGRRRGVTRADFARYVREDPLGDGGQEIEAELQRERQKEKKHHSTALPLMKFPLHMLPPCDSQGIERRSAQMTPCPGLHYDSLDHTLRITVGNNYFRYVGIPAQQHFSANGLLSPVNGLEVVDRGTHTDGSTLTQSSTQGLQRLISQEEPLGSLGQLDKGFQTREISLHPFDSNPPGNCHDEFFQSSGHSRDELKAYCTQPEERSPEAKRLRYSDGDTEKLHSVEDDRSGFTSGMGSNQQPMQIPVPGFLEPHFQELNLARQKQEEEDRRIDTGDSSSFKTQLSDVRPRSAPVYSLHHHEEAFVVPRTLILKQEPEVDMDPSVQLESSSSQLCPAPSGHPTLLLSAATASFASEIEDKGAIVNNLFREKFDHSLCHAEKLEISSEEAMPSTDYLLPHEIAVQDGNGFSRILSMFPDSASMWEGDQLNFANIEDEERFLYGEEEMTIKTEPSLIPTIKLEPTEEPSPEHAKIHELVRSMGLGNLVAELSKLAESTHQQQFSECRNKPHEVSSTGNLNHHPCEMRAPPLSQKTKSCFFCKKPEH